MSRQQAPPAEPRGRLERRLRLHEDNLHDLAEEQRRLREDLAAVMERIDAGIQPSGGADGPADASPTPRRTARGPAGRSSASGWKRALRFALRSTVGLARKLWWASDPAPPHALVVETATEPAPTLPSLGVVLLDSPGERSADRVRRQTEPPTELIFWNPPAFVVQDAGGHELRRGEARDEDDLRRSTDVDYLVTVGGDAELPASAFELARLACATEDLAFLALPAKKAQGAVIVARRELWHREGLDNRALKRARRSRPAVGKVLQGGTLPAGAQTLLRRIGAYCVAPLGTDLRWTTIYPLAADAEPAGESPVDGPERRTGAVLLLLSSSLAGGRDQLTADLLRHLAGDRFDFSIVTLAASDELQRERLLQLEPTASAVYPLGEFLPAEAAPSALALLARRQRAVVLHLGGKDLPPDLAQKLEGASPGVAILDRPRRENWPGVQICGVKPAMIAAASRAELRRRLEVPDDAILVAMAGDLLVRQRPEDFIALAHRLRDDRRFRFLLAGRGPRAGTLDDLDRYLAPGNFRRLSAVPLDEILAAADVACTTGERQSLPYFPLAALAAGRPVVACDVDGLGDLLAKGPCGLAVPVGDLAAFEEALLALADGDERRRLGEEGRRRFESSFGRSAAMESYRELLARATHGESR